jgi:hypothetical protein
MDRLFVVARLCVLCCKLINTLHVRGCMRFVYLHAAGYAPVCSAILPRFRNYPAAGNTCTSPRRIHRKITIVQPVSAVCYYHRLRWYYFCLHVSRRELETKTKRRAGHAGQGVAATWSEVMPF